METAHLLLQDGSLFEGFFPISPIENSVVGEIVFTTGMTGYVETLTDPSYAGQIIVFTYPLIGNYGVPPREKWESEKIHAAGVVIGQLSDEAHHAESEITFLEWLKQQNVPLICDVDTRALTKKLRSRGTMMGALTNKSSLSLPNAIPLETIQSVPIDKPKLYGKGKKRVLLIDCGVKNRILNHLLSFPIEVLRVPPGYDFSNEKYDGVMLSNGPGDPQQWPEAIAMVEKLLEGDKPVFGICLGMQLLALAAGSKTYKLSYGHRGQNHPCYSYEDQKCFLTSQNHGYAVDEKTLPKDWVVTHRHLNDQSIAGISHQKQPFFAVQFHPEAAPGPRETHILFEKFYQMIQAT